MFIKFSKEDSSMILKLCLSPKVDAGVTFFAQGYALCLEILTTQARQILQRRQGRRL